MDIRSVVLGMAALLAIGSAIAQDDSPSVANDAVKATGGCPRKSMGPPRYPPDAYRNNRTGTTVLSLSLDECGRVLDARVAKSSKTKVLDEAALAAARTWVLEQPTADKLVNGRFETPVDFNLQDDVAPTPSGMGWPSSHKRPRYVLEPPSNDLALIEPVQTARREAPKRSYPPPYPGLSGSFVAVGTKDAPEFWFMPYIDGRIDMAARYRPVMENGEAVVRLFVVCDKPQAVCTKDTDFLMKGLPFAKAKK